MRKKTRNMSVNASLTPCSLENMFFFSKYSKIHRNLYNRNSDFENMMRPTFSEFNNGSMYIHN